MPSLKQFIAAASLSLGVVCIAACAPSTLTVSNDADQLARATYTEAQAEIYKNYVFTHLEDSIPEDLRDTMTFEGASMPSDSEWEPYVVRAKALCDDARTNGWAAAKQNYAEQAFREMMSALPADAPDDMRDMTLDEVMPQIAPMRDVQVAAVTAPGSFCPDIP